MKRYWLPIFILSLILPWIYPLYKSDIPETTIVIEKKIHNPQYLSDSLYLGSIDNQQVLLGLNPTSLNTKSPPYKTPLTASVYEYEVARSLLPSEYVSLPYYTVSQIKSGFYWPTQLSSVKHYYLAFWTVIFSSLYCLYIFAFLPLILFMGDGSLTGSGGNIYIPSLFISSIFIFFHFKLFINQKPITNHLKLLLLFYFVSMQFIFFNQKILTN